MNPTIRIFKYFILIFCALASIYACKPDGYEKGVIVLNLTDWNLPDTVKVAAEFGLDLSTQTTSSCERDVTFVINQIAGDAYKVYGTATYESYNSECRENIVETDTTISGKISAVGRYYFLFLKEEKWNIDSIEVVP